MIQRATRFAKRALGRLFGKTSDTRVDALFKTKDYLEAYADHTDLRVGDDPHAAVGGMWEEIGRLQFEFLVENGLRPEHRMLDIGCGTLRGGRHFVRYLNEAGYTGMDISPKAIEFGRQLVEQEGLTAKRPRLIVSANKDLKFGEFPGETFDFLLAQSVFTHLNQAHIAECFAHVGRVMKPGSTLYFTFYESPEFEQTGAIDFRYPFSFFQALADRHGFALENRSRDYKHPRGQQLATLRRV